MNLPRILLHVSTSLLLLSANLACAGDIVTFAGTGVKGFSGDGGPATKAQINNPFGISRGPDGALYICDTDNQRVRRVSPEGTISTYAGNGTRGYAGDGGPATQAALNEPYEIRFDATGNLYFVEQLNAIVRRVDAKSRIITTIAGTGQPGFGGDGGPAVRAQFNEPHSIGFDRSGDLYVCDIKNHRVRKVDMKSGIISTFAGTGEKKATPDGAAIQGSPLNGPRALAFDQEGNLWLALREGNAVFRFDPAKGAIQHVAGTGKSGFTAETIPAATATLNGPKGLSIGPDGRIYLADTESHSIRRIDPKAGLIELVAGTGQKGDGPEGAPKGCALNRPHGVFVDRDGTVFIGDSESHRVLAVRP